MTANSTIIYGEDNSFFVVSNDILDSSEYGVNTFIVHTQGNPKSLYRLYKEHKDMFKGRILFTYDITNFIKNNSVKVEEGLYEYTHKHGGIK
jgi:hypothetical protein